MVFTQARSKHKMTLGAERVAHINSPPPAVPQLKHSFCYMSDHYFCLQYLLFLSLIFCLCWLWRNRDLVWDIVSGKFGKRLLSGFFLPNKVISYVYEGQSICSVLVNMQHREVVQSRVSRAFSLICPLLMNPCIMKELDLLSCLLQSATSLYFLSSPYFFGHHKRYLSYGPRN